MPVRDWIFTLDALGRSAPEALALVSVVAKRAERAMSLNLIFELDRMLMESSKKRASGGALIVLLL